jgi:hypothetical protein
MKHLSLEIKTKEETQKINADNLKNSIAKIPNLSWNNIPI